MWTLENGNTVELDEKVITIKDANLTSVCVLTHVIGWDIEDCEVTIEMSASQFHIIFNDSTEALKFHYKLWGCI